MRLFYVVSCLALCSVALCDYQVEIQLERYTNSMGQLANGECCDLSLGTSCSPSEACDVQFIFMIQNLDTSTMFNSKTLGAGRYDNVNQIDFTNCAELPTTTSVAASNPLTFSIPSGEWTGTHQLRMTTSIQDFDPAAGSMGSRLQEIATPAFDITRPASPSNDFSDTSTIPQGPAQITLRYRVICTEGTCGNDCSQTTGCTPWTPACDGTTPITMPPPETDPTSPTNPCISSPCLNGGTCTPVAPGVFQCQCIMDEYQGEVCDMPLTTTSTVLVTSGTMDADNSTTSMITTGPGSGSGALTGHYSWIIVCTSVLIIRTLL